METLAGPVARVLYTRLQDTGDPVFQELTGRMADQKHEEEQIATDYLADAIKASSSEETQTVLVAVDRYHDLAATLLTAYQDDLTTLGIQPDILQEDLMTAITRFYTRIGLPT